ncbi:MAG: response regulator transcription factor [Candidatus Marinimicrobia bacterium]|nr:response regulator transcription factor [Candidatus Neomarinimicrobiota bacterium]
MNEDNLQNSKILLVEDEESLAEGLLFNLSEEGYSVVWVKDGKKALEQFDSQPYDLIILDIMLPYINGFEVAKYVREKSPMIPILMLTARTAVHDRVRGLEIGANDYLTKPFHLQELLARVKGILRRKSWYQSAVESTSTYQFGENEINFADFSCRSENKKFRLTQQEAMVMKYLIQKKDKIVSREELLEKVWNISSEIETRTVDNFIARLRKYFEPDTKKPVYIKSIRSAGYMFVERPSS